MNPHLFVFVIPILWEVTCRVLSKHVPKIFYKNPRHPMATPVHNCAIIKERLSFCILQKKPKKPIGEHHWIHTDDIYEYLYYPFAFDFGPPSIAQVYRFVKTIDGLLKISNKQIFFYSLNSDRENTTNALFLMGSYCIFSLGWTANKTEKRFLALQPFLEFYRDASEGPALYGLPMEACFRAMEKAKCLGWIDLKTFDYEQYTFYEQVENGDFNWIIPNKFIAMCSPTTVSKRTPTSITHTPEYYIPYFKEHGVSTVIRLNTVEYDRDSFVKTGIDHVDMYFVDGTSPPIKIVESFLNVVESAPGVVAVHCKQGLGRTGSLIACYIMKHFDFNAGEAIAFLRIQRPGSVVGPQQHFLHRVEPLLRCGQTDKLDLSQCHTIPLKCSSTSVVTGVKKANNQTPVKVS